MGLAHALRYKLPAVQTPFNAKVSLSLSVKSLVY